MSDKKGLLIQFTQDSESRTSHLSAAAALPSKESVIFWLFIQLTVATGGSQFVFFRPPLLHKFELVWAYLLLPFGLWVDGNPLGTPELKNRSYLPLFFLSRRAA